MQDFNEPKHRPYSTKLKSLAKSNRHKPTDAEQKLWRQLRNKYKDLKFRRQFSIDNKYIADFVCLEKRLIIEIDGGQHNENGHDKERTRYLENIGFKVIRFWNNDVLNNIQVCLDAIYRELHYTPHPNTLCSPSPARGEGTAQKTVIPEGWGKATRNESNRIKRP